MPTLRQRPSARGRGHSAEPSHFGLVTWLVIVVAVVALAGYGGKIYIEHQTMVLGSDWEKKNRELAFLLKEQDNLRMEKESYTNGAYILPTAHTKLGLQPPQPGQVRRLTSPAVASLLAANHPK